MITTINSAKLWVLQCGWERPCDRLTGFGRPKAGTSTLAAGHTHGKNPSSLLYLRAAPYKIIVQKDAQACQPFSPVPRRLLPTLQPSQFALGLKVIITLLGWDAYTPSSIRIYIWLAPYAGVNLHPSLRPPKTGNRSVYQGERALVAVRKN